MSHRKLYQPCAGRIPHSLTALPAPAPLVIRLTIGATACVHGIELLTAGALPVHLAALLHVGLGTLVIIGLWTLVAGALFALTAIADAYTHPALCRYWVLVGTTAAAMALIGLGRWSVDARLFGRKVIAIPARKRAKPPP